jgi:hypothetical protein
MDFKKLQAMFPIILIGLLFCGFLIWNVFLKTNTPASENDVLPSTVVNLQKKSIVVKVPIQAPPAQMAKEANKLSSEVANQDDSEIQQQLDRDRQQQKITKDLKNKLEQTNLELEQEKAVSEINKLKKENIGAFNEPSENGQSNLPDIKVEYIGGDKVKKDAILSIGSTSYQVKPNSSLTDKIQVVSISDSSVTLHFSAPQDLTKTIDYKPE